MKDFTTVFIIIGLVILAIMLAPMLTLWGINTLAEQAGSDLYIPHNPWSYLATLSILACVRGSSKR